MKELFVFLVLFIPLILFGKGQIAGKVSDSNGSPLGFANLIIENHSVGSTTDENGKFSFETEITGEHNLIISYVGYLTNSVRVNLTSDCHIELNILLKPSPGLNEIVVSGTLKEMSRKDSPVAVEVYSPTFFKKNPTPSLYEALHNVNGVRPQLNCNVCNTGDIHINGLEGPYTMVLIDGMPIVSGLSTVYGLMGIPSSMIERVEIIKGPASSLYGSEAIGGLINVITKSPMNHSKVYGEIMTTSWLESQVDMGFKSRLGKRTKVLTGIHIYNYQNPKDNNGDNFTDVTLSKRFSIFQKWNIERDKSRILTIGGRYYLEDRWGGEMQWTPGFRGSDSIYGESIFTNRIELFSKYQLPVREHIMLTTSFNNHRQNSYYGYLPFMANQTIVFTQLAWFKKIGLHDLTTGLTGRYTLYDDNTVATENQLGNSPEKTILPGLFVQNDVTLSESSRLLLGMRYDHHEIHGGIWTPRIAYKLTINAKNSVRVNAGTGFRVVNIFTEDHAALTGSREVIIEEDLNPEKSYNININYLKKIYSKNGNYLAFDCSIFHSRFSNKIIADYDTDPNKIIYNNLDGYAISQGVTINIDALISSRWRIMTGITLMDVYSTEKNENGKLEKIKPVLTESWSGTWSISYQFVKPRISIDYTGTVYGPMRLPLLSETDPRKEYSPWWSLQNVQLTYKTEKKNWEVFCGIKNLLNFLPPANSIARPHDPFDKEVDFDNNGKVVASSKNPYALTFDPAYVYAPNQGIRTYVGLRYNIF